MTTLYVVAFLTLFAGVMVLFLLQAKLRHLSGGGGGGGGPAVLRADSSPRSRLRSAVMGDEAKVQRLVEYERRLNPQASQRDAELIAYQRWMRDQGR